MSVIVNTMDPRVRRTRRLLLDAFMTLLGESDFESVTVQAIAERAEVNRATFYAHFEDKYDLLDSMIHDQFEQMVAERLPTNGVFDAAYLRAVAQLVFTLLRGVHGHCGPVDKGMRPVFEAALQREVRDLLAARLRRAYPPNTLAPERADALLTMLSWTIFGGASQWSLDERPQPVEVEVERIVSVLVDGVGRILSLPNR